jgi:hypothetical protein
MRCPSCGGENPAGTKFCIECGIPLPHRCPQCGAENLPRAKFCGACGTPLPGPAEAPPPHPRMARPQSLLSYTPSHLAEKILTSKAALEGERKQDTVLLTELRGRWCYTLIATSRGCVSPSPGAGAHHSGRAPG